MFEQGLPIKNLKPANHFKVLPVASIETKVMSGDSFLDKLQKNFTWKNSEKRNRVFAGGGGGAQCAHPLENKKAWLG